MTDRSKILITGATGNVGSEVLRLLVSAGVRVVAAGRRAGDTTAVGTTSVPMVRLDFRDPTTYESALDGVSKIFLVRPPDITNVKKHMVPFILAAKERSVEQMVFLSLQGVEHNPIVPHHTVERAIVEAGVPYTFLRPSFFMQNLSTTHRDEIRLRGEILVPAGRGKTSFIDIRDIAAVAALALTHDGHVGQAYELTGSEALDYYEVASIITEALGRPVHYANPSIWRFYREMRTRGLAVPFVLVMIALYTVARFGKAAGLTDTTRCLLGHDPITFRAFARDYRSVWQ